MRVRVGGINVRPHRPPTRSGEPVLFATLEDEVDILQVTVSGDAIDRCTAVFLVSPAIIVEGTIRKGRAVSLAVERALTLKRVSFAQFQAFPSRPQRIELAEVEEGRVRAGSGVGVVRSGTEVRPQRKA